MVAPVTSAPVVGRPNGSAAMPGKALVSARIQESFLARLRAPHAPRTGAAGEPPSTPRLDEDKAPKAAQMFPRGEGEEDASAALAPGDRSVLGEPRMLEPGEWLALFSPGAEPVPVVAQGQQHPGVADISVLMERWVRRVALGGDARRGVAKLDIGAGRFAGAELVVVAEAGRVAIELSVPGATDASLARRLQSRLERRGYTAEVTVR